MPPMDIPVLNLTLPIQIRLPHAHYDSITIPLHCDHLDLSWMEYFKMKRLEDPRIMHLYQQIKEGNYQSRIIIRDNRKVCQGRKTWRLNNTLRQFINGFILIRKFYNANLKICVGEAHRPSDAEMMHPPNPVQGYAPAPRANPRTGHAADPFQVPGPSCGSTYRNSPSTTRKNGNGNHNPSFRVQGQPNEQRQPVMFPNLNVPIAEDDANSMAASSVVSHFRLNDLTAQGIQFEPIKPEIEAKFSLNADNLTLLKIRDEIKNVRASGNWMRFTSQMPTTANLLLLLFDGSQ